MCRLVASLSGPVPVVRSHRSIARVHRAGLCRRAAQLGHGDGHAGTARSRDLVPQLSTLSLSAPYPCAVRAGGSAGPAALAGRADSARGRRGRRRLWPGAALARQRGGAHVFTRGRAASKACMQGALRAAAGPYPPCSETAPCFTARWYLHRGHRLGRCAQASSISQLRGARALPVDSILLSGGA